MAFQNRAHTSATLSDPVKCQPVWSWIYKGRLEPITPLSPTNWTPPLFFSFLRLLGMLLPENHRYTTLVQPTLACSFIYIYIYITYINAQNAQVPSFIFWRGFWKKRGGRVQGVDMSNPLTERWRKETFLDADWTQPFTVAPWRPIQSRFDRRGWHFLVAVVFFAGSGEVRYCLLFEATSLFVWRLNSQTESSLFGPLFVMFLFSTFWHFWTIFGFSFWSRLQTETVRNPRFVRLNDRRQDSEWKHDLLGRGDGRKLFPFSISYLPLPGRPRHQQVKSVGTENW